MGGGPRESGNSTRYEVVRPDARTLEAICRLLGCANDFNRRMVNGVFYSCYTLACSRNL